MGLQARRELLESVYSRYRAASRHEKTLILDGFCAATGSPARGQGQKTPPASSSLWSGGDPGAEQDLGGRQLSVVGAFEGSAAALAPLGQAEAEDLAGRRAAALGDESADDGSAIGPSETAAGAPALRPNQTGQSAQTPYSADASRPNLQFVAAQPPR